MGSSAERGIRVTGVPADRRIVPEMTIASGIDQPRDKTCGTIPEQLVIKKPHCSDEPIIFLDYSAHIVEC